MKPLRFRLREASLSRGIPQHVVEKDYALSYILAGVSNHPVLKNSLVFKGGTALKKMFFGEYRFSEDLDFSYLDAPKGDELERCVPLCRVKMEISHDELVLLEPKGVLFCTNIMERPFRVKWPVIALRRSLLKS
jgi:hypothetical protein